MTAWPRCSVVGDSGVLIEFADTVTDAAHDQVLCLDQALQQTPFPGLIEVVPASVSLLAVFDPVLADHAGVETRLRKLALQGVGRAGAAHGVHQIDVCYDTAFGPDLAEVAGRSGMTEAAVIDAHLAGDYRVFMYGFAPGYAYLQGVAPDLHLPRKDVAVRGVAAGSVIIAGPQCLITTLTMPTGWWIIGRAVQSVLTGQAGRPFRLDVGDRVQFRRVDRASFDLATRTPVLR